MILIQIIILKKLKWITNINNKYQNSLVSTKKLAYYANLVYELGFDSIKSSQRQEVILLGIQCLMLIASCITITPTKPTKRAKGTYTPQSGKGTKLSFNSFIDSYEGKQKSSQGTKKLIKTSNYTRQEYSKIPEKYKEEELAASK